MMVEDAEKLRKQNEKLQAALRVERASAIVVAHRLPPSMVQVLAATAPEEQEGRAQQIARELAQRWGVPAGSPDLVSQEHEEHPPARVEAGGEASGEEAEVDPLESRPELGAVTKSGPEGATPADPGPVTAKDARTQAIRSSSNWDELEAAVRLRRG